MGKTSISWTEHSWNPTRGCSRISPGCLHCYAERMAGRFCGLGRQDRGKCEDGPFAGFAEITPAGARWTGKVELIPEMLDIPLRRKKPTTYFVNSMSDLFHERLSDEAIDRVFAVMALSPQHTFQVLTKRAERMQHWASEQNPYATVAHRIAVNAANIAAHFPRDFPNAHSRPWPLPNVWLGVSVGYQMRKSRIDLLRQAPAAVRFLSLEPLLEDLGTLDLEGIDWVIVGGESGPGARPCDIAWIRSIVRQCKEAGVRCFVKQWGANPWCGYKAVLLRDRKGENPVEWPEDVRVREYLQCR